MVSHKHKFIFIHIGRTAGCSIERALCNDYCGPESKLTNNKWVLYDGSEDFIKNSNTDTQNAAGHWLPIEIKGYFGNQTYDDYFKFTVVRNPWQRILSQFKKTQDKKDGMSFSDWVQKSFVDLERNMSERFYKPCTWWIKDEMDYIIRYENLDEDFKKLLSKIGISNSIKLEKVKMLPGWNHWGDDIDSVNYQNYYDETTKKIIEKNFKDDIERFGYEF
tara:strand:- start:325 stop:981 length:657 start_codon:yes stop_codon:yes gene_type:complete